jgi:hypothetical protein
LGDTAVAETCFDRHGNSPVHQPAAPRYFVFGAAQRDFRHSPFRPVGEMGIERLRDPVPEAGRFIDRNSAHRVLSIVRLAATYLLSFAYEFETERRLPA